jgi:hypothetical protein
MAKKIIDSREAPFVWFDIALDDAGLTPYEFRLYAHIARRTGGGRNQFFEALTNAAVICRMSRRQAFAAIKSLLRRQMIKKIKPVPGYPVTYELTDKSEWIDWAEPVHLLHEGSAPDARGVVHQMHEGSAPDARGVVHQMHSKKTKASKQVSKQIEAAAATRAREKTAAAAPSIYPVEVLEKFIRATKNHSTNPGGLAVTLHKSAEEDWKVALWLAEEEKLKTKAAQQEEERITEDRRNAEDSAVRIIEQEGVSKSYDYVFLIHALSFYQQFKLEDNFDGATWRRLKKFIPSALHKLEAEIINQPELGQYIEQLSQFQ